MTFYVTYAIIYFSFASKQLHRHQKFVHRNSFIEIMEVLYEIFKRSLYWIFCMCSFIHLCISDPVFPFWNKSCHHHQCILCTDCLDYVQFLQMGELQDLGPDRLHRRSGCNLCWYRCLHHQGGGSRINLPGLITYVLKNFWSCGIRELGLPDSRFFLPLLLQIFMLLF